MTSYRDKVDTDRCYFCPETKNIEVHHIVPQRFNGSDNRENLVAVCERCHEKLESLYDKRFYETLGIDDEQGERSQHFPCSVCVDERATVKLSNKKSAFEFWTCLNCATERFPADRLRIAADTTGRAATREEWCEYAEVGRKMVSIDYTTYE